jgi:hypothetical protein
MYMVPMGSGQQAGRLLEPHPEPELVNVQGAQESISKESIPHIGLSYRPARLVIVSCAP